jgi:restriction endonuclease S subunit
MTTSVSSLIYPVPKGWRLYTAGDIKSTEPHSCVAGPFGSKISSKYFVDDGVPIIRGNNLKDDLTRFVPNGFVFVSDARAQEYRPQHVRGGDLVFTCWGTIGQVGLIPEDGPYPEYIISNKQLKLRVASSIADPRFCFYYFASPRYAEYVRSRSIGGAVPGINLGILKSLAIALPPITVQRRIADVLSGYDDLIENNRRRMALLEDSARKLYNEWFVRLRFPGYEHTPITNGVPEGWKRKPLEALCMEGDGIQTGPFGSQLHQSDYSEDGIPVVMPKDLIGFRISVSSIARIPEDLGSPETAGVIANRAKGATMPNLNTSLLRSVPILIAPRRLQEIYAEQADTATQLCDVLDEQNQRLRTARDLLLPRLMSGELAV